MPQGKGTYGSQVGRPSKKHSPFANDNSSILTKGQLATPRQYSNPIDFSKPVPNTRGGSIKRSHPAIDPNKPIQLKGKHPAIDSNNPSDIGGKLMSGDRKTEWTKFMTDMPKGYRTKEEIGAKRKELLAKK